MHNHDRALAIVGMGCRLPGGVDTPAALWQLLADGQDAVGDLPAGREVPLAGTERPGGYLRDVAGFDADFFGVSRREADVLDPQHRLLLEVAWEALEHAGLPPERMAGTSTGVYVGISYDDYVHRLAGQPRELEGATLTNGYCVAAGRISYLLGLHGPAVALDTACSSSLVAVHLAGQALRAGECDVAIAGGVNLMLWPTTTRSFSRMGMLSPTGRCRPFDAAADGFVRSEGGGAVVLKRLADATRDGDRILAVIRGSAVNQDGRSDGLTTPSAGAQRAVYERALADAGVAARDVGLVEAHGTGTPVGDPIEFASLAAVYGGGGRSCAVGSVKSNIGHLEPAAGVTGLIKAVLCLWHGQIPPNPHFTRWNPALVAERTRLFVPTSLTGWPTGTPTRLAAVSSFGFSGTNAHVVLEQAPAIPAGAAPAAGRAGEPAEPAVVLVAAGSVTALPLAAGRLADWLERAAADVRLHDVAHTLAVRRSPGRGRLGVVATSHRDLVDGLRAFAAGRVHPGVVSGSAGAGAAPRPVWVFSGQGSQWAGMGRQLLAAEPAFAAALARLDPLIHVEAGFSVLDVLREAEPVTGCGQIQPLLFAVQVALAATWQAYGVRPAAVVGHSMGEVAAAVVSGALSIPDGVKVICRRSALLARITGAGAMASVALDRAVVEAELAANRNGGPVQVSVAVHAAPGSTVVAGAPEQVRRLVAGWEERGVPARLIAVDVASHSPQVDPLLDDLAAALADVTAVAADVPCYSTVLDDPSETPAFDAGYWCANLRRPVRFAAAIAAAAADRHRVFVEVSPHPVVTQAVIASLDGLCADPVVLPTLRRDEDSQFGFRTQLAALHCAGVAVDWSTVYGAGALLDVPPITFDRRRHWVDREPQSTADVTLAAAGNALPGHREELPGEPPRQIWRGNAGTAALPWLAEHRVHGRPVLPGAAYCAVGLAVAGTVFDTPLDHVELRDVRFHELLGLAEHTELITTVQRRTPHGADCELFAHGEDGTWVQQASATVHRIDAPPPGPDVDSVDELTRRHPVALDVDRLYAMLRERGIEHGPAFSAITSLHRSTQGDSCWARIAAPAAPGSLGIHPILLDLGTQVLVATLVGGPGDGLVLPTAARAVRVLADPASAVFCHARVTTSTAGGFTGEVRLLDDSGRPVVVVEGLEVTHRADRAGADRWFLEPSWPLQACPPATAIGDWLVIAEDDPSAAALAGLLRTAGAATTAALPVDDTPLQRLHEEILACCPEAPPLAVVLLNAPGPAPDPVLDGLRRTRRALAVANAVTARYPSPPRLYIVTWNAQAAEAGTPANVAQATQRGLIRVLAHELPALRATLVDADPAGGLDGGLSAVARELLAAAPEDEVALRGERRRVARVNYAPLSDTERAESRTRSARAGFDQVRLRAGRIGDLDRLELAAADRRAPGPGEVEIQVRATGVNFRDVLTVMGLLPADGDVQDRIGFECSGVVTAVGDDVAGLRAGDDVVAVDLRGGAFSSFTTVPAAFVAPRPPDVDPVAAAGLLTGFLTAWYALRDVADVRPGERVLIHCATGGTGLAAVAVARLLGAEVLATAGTEEKRQYLRGIGIRHVMDSRSLDFTAQAREATGGDGVDVVLNSLPGPAIRAGLEALRPFGRFVELGVRDIIADAALGLAPLRHNITLSTVDLIELQRTRPERFAEVLAEVLAAFAAGSLTPVPCRTFPLDRATDAFRLMAGARHIGKLIMTAPDDGVVTVVDDRPPVRPDGAYLVTGGLRGVGLATARWLAGHGAGHIVLNGRHVPTPDVEQVIAELRGAGTRISVITGDISVPGTAERLVTAATADGLPVRGVVHAAMVLADAVVANVTDEQLDTVWRPKVTGAWRLHRALDGHSPDWFVLYSSMSSLLGNPGQGAYAAANAWLDAFAGWRTAHGLPTLAVNWGPWGETGVATGFAARGFVTIPTDAGLRALGALLTHRRVRTAVIPGTPSTWIRPAVRQSSLFGLLTDGVPGDGEPAGERSVGERLTATAAGLPRRTALETYLTGQIRAVLRLDGATLDPQTPLRALGFDSLLSMELRVRLESDLGIKLPGNFVWQYPILAALAAGLAERMQLPLDAPAPPRPPSAAHQKGNHAD